MRARRHLRRHLERRQIVGARHRVVHVAASEKLAAFVVVHARFEQRLADPLRQSAVHLSFDDHRIDDVAEVVARAEPDDRHDTRVGIHLDFADMRAGGKREVRRIVERCFVQSGLEPVQRIVVRHVRGERDFAERLAAIGSGNGELAVLELDVGLRGFEQMRSNLLALRDHLVERLDDRGAADRQRSRSVRSHAEQHASGIAVHDVDVLERNAEARRHHLRERRLVPLSMAVRAGEDRHRAGRMDAHFTRFEKPRACAERSRDVRRREPARFDVRRVSQAAQPAALRRFFLARGKAFDVGNVHRFIETRVVAAGVVEQRNRRLIGKCANEIAAPNLVLRDARFDTGLMDDPFDHVRRFGTACAAIRVDGRGVRKRRRHFAMDHRRRVLSGEQRRVENRRDARCERRQIRAHVRRRVHAQREKLAIPVERQLRVRDVIAAVRVRQKRFAAFGGPFDRPSHTLRRPHHCGFFGIQIDLRAETAADVGRDDANLVFWKAEHECRHQQALDVRILIRDVERVAVVGTLIRCDGGARLDRVRHEPIVDDVELRDVRGFCERCIHGALVADRPRVALVARRLIVNLRRARLQRIDDVDHGRQHFIIDVDQFRSVFRLIARFGDHQGDLVADVAHFSFREHRMRRLLHRRSVDARDQPAARQSVDAFEIGARVDRNHAGRFLRVRRVDVAYLRVRVR